MTLVAGLSVASVLVAIIALVISAVRRRETDTTALAERLARLETKVDVFWRGVSFDAARMLHSPHPQFAERDRLLEKFLAETLTGPDAAKLGRMMSAVLDDHASDPGQRMAASVVLRYLTTWYDRQHV